MSTSRAIRRAYDQQLADVGLILSEASLLAFVHLNGPMTQARLADRLGLQRAGTGAMVDKLQARGLVERRPDPTDRRVWLVATTAAGSPVVAEIDRIDKNLRKQLRAGISKAERDAMSQTLMRLQQNLAAILGG